MDGRTDQTNLTIPMPAFVSSRIDGSSQPLWQNGSFRSEYRFTKQNALSFDAMVSGGQFASANSSYFSDFDGSGAIVGLFDEFSHNHSHSNNEDFDLGFRHELVAEGVIAGVLGDVVVVEVQATVAGAIADGQR